MYRIRIDGLTLVAVAFLCFIGFNIVRDRLSYGRDKLAGSAVAFEVNPSSGGPPAEQQADLTAAQISAAAQPVAAADASSGVAHVLTELQDAAASADPGDPNVILFPYPNFVVTQGVHGAEYGQMAVDIAAGKGAPVMSPINGTVTALYVDEYGNPVLVLDNARWTVMLYHSQFSVKVGDTVTIDTTVGLESNQGYTVDGFGRLCAGRDCGYHSHMNVYDKQLGSNVNPFDVLQRRLP